LSFLYLEGGEPALRAVPVPDAMWGIDRPPQVLDAMSRCLGDFEWLLRSAAPEGLHGAAFRCEAWTVESKPGAGDEEEVKRESRAKRLHLHPRRVEERSMWAVDRAGILYGAMLARGGAPARVQVDYPKPGGRLITGTIPEALERIVASVLGVTLGT
jgi:hypothetical protein